MIFSRLRILLVTVFAAMVSPYLLGRGHCSRFLRIHIMKASNGPSELGKFSSTSGYTSVMIVPTGIGASIGGYGGDALPSARLLSCVTDTLIVHPNIMNGAMLYWPCLKADSGQGFGIQYVEGFALDEFSAGRLSLSPKRKRGQRIGLLLDKGIEPELRLRHTQVIYVDTKYSIHSIHELFNEI